MVDRLTAGELIDRLPAGESAPTDGDAGDPAFTLVDTRRPDSFEGWHLPGAENVPFDPTEGFDDDHRAAVEDAAGGDAVVVVCGKGLTSTPFGIHLEDDGYDDVTVVRGGMEATSTVHETVDVTDGGDSGTVGADVGDEHDADDDLVVRQLQRRATGCLGYVVGSRATGEAVAVDPTRQTDEFVAAAAAAGLSITAVVDTHLHADHLSGGPSLAADLDVPYRLGASGVDRSVEHDHEAFEDGETIRVGDATLRAVRAPGHTEEMVNLVVDDAFLLTSDTLHADGVGRTELGFGEDRAEGGAELLHETIHERLLAFDDDVSVLPGHVSLADDLRYEYGRPGEPVERRLGSVRKSVDVVGLDRRAFVREVTEDLPEKPDQYETVVAVNAGREAVETEEDAAELETGPNSCSA